MALAFSGIAFLGACSAESLLEEGIERATDVENVNISEDSITIEENGETVVFGLDDQGGSVTVTDAEGNTSGLEVAVDESGIGGNEAPAWFPVGLELPESAVIITSLDFGEVSMIAGTAPATPAVASASFAESAASAGWAVEKINVVGEAISLSHPDGTRINAAFVASGDVAGSSFNIQLERTS